MDGKRISQLTPDTSPTTDDYIVTVDGSTTQNKRVDLGSLPVSNPTNALFDTKVDKAPGKQLSDQNYTQDEKNKLAGIEAGAEVNEVSQADLNLKANTSDLGTAAFEDVEDLPVSTATQTALNTKATKLTLNEYTVPFRDTDGAGEPTAGVRLVASSSESNSVARRTSDGRLKVSTATESNDATTKAQMDAADALKLNISDNRVELRGVGFPQGVVSAPVGSTYIDTAATNGAIEWKKATGTGNTGWVVSVGDTGRRRIPAADLLNGWTATGGASDTLWIRRVGNTVQLSSGSIVGIDGTAATSNIFWTLPDGFRTQTIGNYSAIGTDHTSAGMSAITKDFNGLTADRTLGTVHTFVLLWFTSNAWPTTLPGTA